MELHGTAILRTARVTALAITAGIGTPGAAQKPLFATDSLIAVRLEAPFRRMLREKESNRHQGQLQVEGADIPIPIEVALRGTSRLESGICSFSGLMLSFDSTAVAGTPFAGQSALPLTAHCKDRPEYEEYVVLEYFVYRAYEIVSEVSLYARLARVEYFDSERREPLTTRYAFFVEHWDDAASRRGWMMVRAPAVPAAEYPAADRNRFEVFQYLIGNTDWSYVSAEPDEDSCCHNTVPIGNPAGPVFPVPFDFDQAGIVNAAYARPSPQLPIGTVRERLYRGVCLDRSVLEATLALFRAKQAALRALLESIEGLSDRSRRAAIDYVDSFYQIIGDARAVEREFVKGCRRP